MKKRWSKVINKTIEEKRLLVISPFNDSVKYITQETANKRNEIMVELSDKVFLAYATKNGNLDRLLKNVKGKKISSFK